MIVCPLQSQCLNFGLVGKEILFLMHKKKKKFKTSNLFDREKNIDWLTTGNAWRVNKNIELGTVLDSLDMTINIFFKDGLTLRIPCEWYKNCQLMSNYKIISVFNKLTVFDLLITNL